MIYTRGCIEGVTDWFKENMIIIGGVAVGVALMQVCVFAISSKQDLHAANCQPEFLNIEKTPI